MKPRVYRPVSLLDLIVALRRFPDGVYVSRGAPPLPSHARCVAPIAHKLPMWPDPKYAPIVFLTAADYSMTLPHDVARSICRKCRHGI